MATELPDTSTTARPPAGLAARFFGIVLSPRDTYAGVVSAPRWFGMLALVTLVTAGAIGWFMSTEVGRQAVIDQQVNAMESFGVQLTDEQYDRLIERAGSPLPLGMTVGSIIVFGPLVTAIIAGVLLLVFNAGLGGDATYKQVFSVLVHAGAINVLQQLFVTPLNYFRESMSSPTNAAVLLPMLDEQSFLAYLLGTIDLFTIWWVMVLAIGLAVLYRRRTQPVAITLFSIYVVIAIGIAAVRSWLGGS